jgi:hypothetical protein
VYNSSVNAVGFCKLVITNLWTKCTTDYCSFADQSVPILSCISRLYHRKNVLCAENSCIGKFRGRIWKIPLVTFQTFPNIFFIPCFPDSLPFSVCIIRICLPVFFSSVKLLSSYIVFVFVSYMWSFLFQKFVSYSLWLIFELRCYNVCPPVPNFVRNMCSSTATGSSLLSQLICIFEARIAVEIFETTSCLH